MPQPEDQDPRTGSTGAPRQRDAMDLPPPEHAPVDRRRVVDNQQASGLVVGTLAVVTAVLLGLDAVLPTWSRGLLLVLGPVLVAGVLSRYRLPVGARAVLAVLAAAYVLVLLLAAG